MSGIYLANANEKKTNSKSKKKKKKIWKPKLKVLTISMNVRRCEAFMNSNMLRKRLQIEAKMYSLFSTIYSHIFFPHKRATEFKPNNVIFYSANNAKIAMTPWKMLQMHFDDLFSTFYFGNVNKKSRYFNRLGIFFGHWLKYEPFERKLCDDNHNGINHKILKWQLNRIKSKNSQSTNCSRNC